MNKTIEITGTSASSYEEATQNAVSKAKEHFARYVEYKVVELGVRIDQEGQISTYFAKLRISKN